GAGRRRLGVIAAALAVIAVVGVAAWWFLVRDDAPPPADIATAAESLDGSGGGATGDGVEGEWVVDTSVGSFDDFSGTFAGYRFDEELAGIGANTAAGRTPDVSGSMTVAG